jgi:tetratricopeptide (TPR) repeat protein
VLGGLGDYVSAQAQFARGLRLSQELGDRPNSAYALERLGWMARERGDGATARARLEESLELYRELGDQSGICATTNALAEALSMQGDLVAAKAVLEENLRLARQLEDTNAIGWSLNHLGHIAQLEGEYAEAIRLHGASLQRFRQLGARNTGHIWVHQSLGESYLAQDEAPLAASHFVAALVMAKDLGERASTAWCLAGLAGAAAVNEEPERAAWLWGAAEALRRSLGAREAPASHATRERLIALAQEQIGPAAFAQQWEAGEAATPTEAIERALRGEPDGKAESSAR